MSKQLALSATFSVLIMATYVLFGVPSAREPLAFDAAPATNALEISAPALTATDLPAPLLPSLR